MKNTSLGQIHKTSSLLKSIAVKIFILLLVGLTLPGARGDVTFTTLASFSGVNGDTPSGPLTLGMDGNIYGTTKYGGTGYGTVFKLTPDGTLTALFAFDGVANGRYPLGGL